MKVLIMGEYSGTVRDAFIRKGHDAISCDFLPSESDFGPHYQGDVLDILYNGYDLMVAHPDCTYLTCSAEWAYSDGPYHQKVKPETLVGEDRRKARIKAIEFFKKLYFAPIHKKCLENPRGIISSKFMKPTQYIQPYDFGDNASKITGLWLVNLPPLKKTKRITGRFVKYKGKIVERWENQTDSGQNRLSPGVDRWKKRAHFYQGWADAMADQWG
jgi:hypothetical protein